MTRRSSSRTGMSGDCGRLAATRRRAGAPLLAWCQCRCGCSHSCCACHDCGFGTAGESHHGACAPVPAGCVGTRALDGILVRAAQNAAPRDPPSQAKQGLHRMACRSARGAGRPSPGSRAPVSPHIERTRAPTALRFTIPTAEMRELMSNRGPSAKIRTARRPRNTEVSGDESGVSSCGRPSDATAHSWVAI